MIPTIAKTKRVKCGPDFKGGITDYKKVENDLRRLLGDTGAIAVTTFIDYYALPSNFPGVISRPPGSPNVRVLHVETEWERSIDDPRFRAYLMVHEFEALLFVKPDELCNALYQSAKLPQLMNIRSSFETPEDINDNPETAPSKRIIRIFQGYQKTVHGPLVTKRVGLEDLRRECLHLDKWVTWLEGL